MREIILDIIGVIFIIASIVFFYLEKIDFTQGTFLVVAGLTLFVFKGSNVRTYITKLLDKYFNK